MSQAHRSLVLAAIPTYFTLRMGCALLLLKLSARCLPVSGFAVFSQLALFGALANLMAIGGTQNGVIRQVAAAPDAAAIAGVQRAALAIWALLLLLVIVLLALGDGWLSRVLTGDVGAAHSVAAIGAIALVAGPGQIWCGLLSGQRRIAASLGAQALGLGSGTLAAGWFLWHGGAVAAAVAFACGPLVTAPVALALLGKIVRVRPVPGGLRRDIRQLLRYSAALAATSLFAAVTLFALRYAYRQSFDAQKLGYWLAANRISDISTQLLGLFLIQFFVPHLAQADSEAAKRGFVLRCAVIGTAAMAAVATGFALCANWLVPLLLSPTFLPAIPAIRLYLVGDTLRVGASLAMYAAFARGQPLRYAAIELGAVALLAVLALAMIAAGRPDAPQLAYVGAYGTVTLIVAMRFGWLLKPTRRLSMLQG